ncbi:MAG: hypothetical protein A2018_03210 [Alphaproteobacteria bacterium GWF2_58_20]|nr:MAG: hypothetical protein A2018_03210 [Alphaproteobacteria bacterium GWF2_58_20]
MVDFEVRLGVPDDAAGAVDCMRQACGETDYLKTSPENFSLTEEKEREILANPSTEGKYLFLFFAKVDGRIVGSASLSGNSHPRCGHMGVTGISILKDFWGQGMGRALMLAILEKGRELHLHGIHLDVRADNERAIGLYRKLGFIEDGRHEDAMRVGAIYHDLIHMTKIL